jgi:hypothetical protein
VRATETGGRGDVQWLLDEEEEDPSQKKMKWFLKRACPVRWCPASFTENDAQEFRFLRSPKKIEI